LYWRTQLFYIVMRFATKRLSVALWSKPVLVETGAELIFSSFLQAFEGESFFSDFFSADYLRDDMILIS
ncbi:MAG: hypothetical protein OXJ52_00590, partial [Oligoflexia bacterium]|nr:hypothetical protein [Oligoflexia bacterium]